MSKVDFSILNDTDIFYVQCGDPWLAKGYFLDRTKFNKHLNIHTKNSYKDNALCKKDSVKGLRRATLEEQELFYSHFPEEKPKIFKTNNLDHLTIKDMQEAGWKFSYTK